MRVLLALLLSITSCASAPRPPIRVLVYNIHAGKDAKGIDNLERVASLITSLDADVVLLQEVDRGTRRSGNADQLAILMRLTKLHGVFGKSLDYQGGDYGIAILSRWPIASHETVPLHVDPPQPRAGGRLEPRVALFAKIQTPRRTITIANTHFDASPEDTWRAQEVRELLAAARARRPLMIGGDFNATPDSAVIAAMRAARFADCGNTDELSYPADVPVKRIDYLFLGGGVRCVNARVLDTQASDHRPLWASAALPRR